VSLSGLSLVHIFFEGITDFRKFILYFVFFFLNNLRGSIFFIKSSSSSSAEGAESDPELSSFSPI